MFSVVVVRHCEAWNKPWQSLALSVILSETKDLMVCTTSTVSWTLRFFTKVQNDSTPPIANR